MQKVYIILLNYNGWADTIECLESVLRNDYPNYQVIVVDNNSPNNSMDYIKKWAEGKLDVWVDPKQPLRHLSFPPVKKPIPYVYYNREEAESGGDIELESSLIDQIPDEITSKYPLVFIQAGENGGFAAGNNIGIKYALAKNDFEYVCLINNDTVVEKDFLSLIINKMQNNTKIGICASKINYYSNPNLIWSNGGTLNKVTSQTKHIDYQKIDNNQEPNSKITFLTGCMWVIKKEIFQIVGLLNESYFMYVEDLEYSYKVQKAGYRLEIEHTSKIYHKVGASSNGEISEFSTYWMMKNRVKFILSNLKNIYKITSLCFVILTRILRFPKWIFKGHINIVKAQINGFYRGIMKK